MALLLSSRCVHAGPRAAPPCPCSALAPRSKDFVPLPRAACPLGPGRGPPSPLRSGAVRAINNNNSSELTPAFDLVNYLECRVHNVELSRHGHFDGHIINLRILDRPGHVLPVHVGNFEVSALQSKLRGTPTAGRPLTHDLYKDTLEKLGYRVTRVLAVTAMVHNVYLARLHLSKPGRSGAADELDIDARPSDAINMAVRFNAPMYVHKDIATRMAAPSTSVEPESAAEIRASCKQEIMRFNDPTFEYKLKMAVAIADERFADAARRAADELPQAEPAAAHNGVARLRDQVERLLASDRALALVVAIESALEDDRLEARAGACALNRGVLEAAQLRNSLRHLMRARPAQVQS